MSPRRAAVIARAVVVVATALAGCRASAPPTFAPSADSSRAPAEPAVSQAITPDHAAWDEDDVTTIDGTIVGAAVEGAYTVLRVAVDPHEIGPLTQDWVGYLATVDGKIASQVKLEITRIDARGIVQARTAATDVSPQKRVRFVRP